MPADLHRGVAVDADVGAPLALTYRLRVAAVHPRREHHAATVRIAEDDGAVRQPVAVRCRVRPEPLLAQRCGRGGDRIPVVQVEDELVERVRAVATDRTRSDDLHLHSGVGQAEDGAVLPEAGSERFDYREPHGVPVERDGRVIVRARPRPPQRFWVQMPRPHRRADSRSDVHVSSSIGAISSKPTPRSARPARTRGTRTAGAPSAWPARLRCAPPGAARRRGHGR